MDFLLTAYLLLSCLGSLTEARSTYSPRMIFPDRGSTFKRMHTHKEPVKIVLGEQPDLLTAIGKTHLNVYNFQNPNKNPGEYKVHWNKCSDNDCNYNVTVVKQRENSSLVFVCGTDGKETLCCNMNISLPSPSCIRSQKLESIEKSTEGFFHEESEHCILDESEHSADLYIAYSGSEGHIGIYKLGNRRVIPARYDKEQHYAGLLLSRQKDNPSQDRVYAFYKQKNREATLDSDMWHSFVTQVCTADVGGPKNHLQFKWTSQLNARLFCGDTDSRQHFSELVGTATVDADCWNKTKIYALFRNEWGMSAVCVYTIEDIHRVFMNSAIKGSSLDNRPRMCVEDSTNIPQATLRNIDKTSDMEDWILPVERSGPLLVSHHKYTHIYIDSNQHKRNSPNTVMFLSLHNGRIHKVLRAQNHTFVIAEYRPFNDSTHISGIIQHRASKKLYVHTIHELVQIDVTNCSQYGNTCEDCVLARDPDCGWKDERCTSETHGAHQDVAGGDYRVCQASVSKIRLPGKVNKRTTKVPPRGVNVVKVKVPSLSKYFLSCPVSSHHATYSWQSRNLTAVCKFGDEQCLMLIDSMGPQQEGMYQCVSEEKGHNKVLARYELDLDLRSSAGRHQHSEPVVWVCLWILLISLFPSF